MSQLKRIYVSPIGPNISVKFETAIPENERVELQEAFGLRVKGDDDKIQIEGRLGWCSWGF